MFCGFVRLVCGCFAGELGSWIVYVGNSYLSFGVAVWLDGFGRLIVCLGDLGICFGWLLVCALGACCRIVCYLWGLRVGALLGNLRLGFC